MKIDNAIQTSYSRLSAGRRVNSASDDPSGLAASQKLLAQANGMAKGSDNAQTAKDLTSTADSALSSISDSLQRIRELATQAASGTYSADDRKMVQAEINQLKESIGETAKNTEFNTIKVLDGSFSDKTIAVGANGKGQTMSIKNTSLEALGIDKFDVTKPFDVSDIDNAITKVSDSRANLGASANRLEATVQNNQNAMGNARGAEDRIAGADIAKTVTDMRTQQMRQQVQLYAQQNKMQQGSSVLNLLR